jgi:hypothetical protein
MINVVIFSKDRPAQLELLLRSMKRFFVEWNKVHTSILYRHTTEDYRVGYEKTKRHHPEFSYVLEQPGKFKEQTVSLVNPDNQATMFFVDDMVFKNYLALRSDPIRKFLEDDNILCVAIRICPRINYCYAEKRDTPPPKFSSDLRWFWKDPNLKGDFAYPMSIDGNIFKTTDILPLLKEFSYGNPNTLEGALALRPINKPYMICFPDTLVFNIPVNKVQTTEDNHCGNIPAKYLNDQFNSLKRISMSNLEFFKNTACYQKVPLVLESSVTHTPEALLSITVANKIDYQGILSDDNFYSNTQKEKADITVLIPVRNRLEFLKPSVHYMREASANSSLRINLVYIENDNYPKHKDICEDLGVGYVFIPTEISQSSGLFAKSLCYNMGFIVAPVTDWYLFHDLDMVVDKDFFYKLSLYMKSNPRWLQPYTGKRVCLVSETMTKIICSGKYVSLSTLSNKDVMPASSGSTGGSILVRRDLFEKVGGYDPEIFFGYAPEDLFFWTKLEVLCGKLDHITNPFQGGAVYADDPPIEVYHMSHASMANQNPCHADMRSILASFFEYNYPDKLKIVEFKKSLLEMRS